jgi:anaerobic dimethyl sulfoxide reductase subunit A
LSEKKESMTEKKVSRRSMLKWTGALAAAAAVGAVAGYGATELMKPPPTPPPSFKPPLSPEVQARRDAIVKDLINRHADETTTYYVPNTYRRSGDCLGPLKVHLKNRVLTAIEPDDTYNPNVPREDENWDNIVKGTIAARESGRWYAYRKMIYDPRRVIYPMKRVGSSRGDPFGKFVRISWEEALDTLASKLKETKEKYGPYSIFDIDGYNSMPRAYGMGYSHYSQWSAPGHLYATGQAYGQESYGGGNQVSSVFDSKLIVYWGLSPGDNGDTGPTYYYNLAREKGIPIISIGIRYTVSDETDADQWIPIRKGTDTAMQLAVANVLIKEDLYDKAFVDKFVYGFDKWKDYLMGVTDGVEKTPEWAEPLTGVPAQTIREFARLYAKSKPVTLITNQGVSRGAHTEGFAWAGIILQAMTGNMGIPGAHVSGGSARGPAAFGSYPLPNLSAESGRTAAATKFRVPQFGPQKWFEAVLLREKLDKGEITKEQYYNTIGLDAKDPAPNIHVFWSTHWCLQTNEYVNKQLEAFKKLDYVVTYRVWQHDSHNRIGDIILAMPEEMERRAEYSMNAFVDFPNGFVYNDRLLDAPGECRSQEWRDAEVAKRLGIIDDWFPKYKEYGYPAFGSAKWDQMWDDMAKAAYEKWAAAETVKPLNPPSWEDFKKKPIIRWEMPTTPKVALSDNMQKGVKFPTDSGKINAYSEYLAQGEEFLKTTKYGRALEPYPAYVPEKQFQGFHDVEPEIGDRPLVYMNTKARYVTHSWMTTNPWLLDDIYEHVIELSVPDAKARGIKYGDIVRIDSLYGAIQGRASVSARLTPGHVHNYTGRYFDPDPVLRVPWPKEYADQLWQNPSEAMVDMNATAGSCSTDRTYCSYMRGCFARVQVYRMYTPESQSGGS